MNAMNGTLDVAVDDDGNFIDEYGDRWLCVANYESHYAVDREDGNAAGVIASERDGSAVLYTSRDGEAFDCDMPASWIVENNGWERSQ